MIKEIQCDIFDAPIDILVHACNPKGIWGGLAGEVKRRYPEAYKLDQSKEEKDKKLGFGLVAKVEPENRVAQISYIVNLYTQPDISNKKRMTNYEAVARGFEWLNGKITNKNLVVGLPYLFGSGLGGASWPVIKAMIEDAFGESSLQVVICKLPDVK